MPNQPIETERLILREIELSDVDGMFALDSDPEVLIYLGNNPLTKKEQAAEAIEFVRGQYADRGIGRWAVIHKKTNEFMGWSGLKYLTEPEQMNGVFHVYELGYRFAKKFWGKGYATEAAQAWVDYAFNIMKVKSFYAAADIGNKGSINVLQKVGFKITDEFEFHSNPHYWLEQHR